MSELDQDWIQRDLAGGAIWDESGLPDYSDADLQRVPATFYARGGVFDDGDLWS